LHNPVRLKGKRYPIQISVEYDPILRIAIQPDSAIQNRTRIGLDFEKISSGSAMDIQTALITAGECLIRGIFRI